MFRNQADLDLSLDSLSETGLLPERIDLTGCRTLREERENMRSGFAACNIISY